MHRNICLSTDSYKLSHYLQYPPDAEIVYSYLESRGGKFDNLVFFGLQYIIKRHLEGIVVTKQKIDYAEKIALAHIGQFNRAGWEYILNVHGGKLPIRIKAVAEGTVISPHNVMITIENTDPNVPWLPNYLETLLVQVWYPTTVVSQSRYMKTLINASLEHSGNPSLLLFMLHDFGYRGVTCIEQAGIGGAAHLVNFQGTDTIAALELISEYYTPKDEIFEMPGSSIPASEHSTITSWGRKYEIDAMRNMLEKYPGMMACVSDSFNIWNACENIWGKELRNLILERNGTLVIRPDSGDPLVVLPKILEILGKQFGYETNIKGFKVLNPKVRIIQGDGITCDSLPLILSTIESHHWSADNIAFGSGGGLLQMLNRDTCKFAFKCSAIRRSGQWQDVYKDPITDPEKRSKRGRLKLVKNPTTRDFVTVDISDNSMGEDHLQTVFENGDLLIYNSFADIRKRAAL